MDKYNGDEPKPPEPTQAELDARKTQEARSYLASTDWYVTRRMETGKEIPIEISKAREQARTQI